MKILKQVLASILIAAFFCTSVLSFTVFASTGTRTDPFYGYTKKSVYLYSYYGDAKKKIEITLVDFIKGTEANTIVAEENMYNDTPRSDEEWLLMKFHFKYVSGPDEELYACDILFTENSFFKTSGTAVSPISTATFSNERSGLGSFDVSFYPGGQSDVWYGILVKKTVGYPLYRIATGYNKNTYSMIYTWFSTNPTPPAPTPPSAPGSIKAASASYNSIKISWTAVSGATGYAVYRSTSKTGTYSRLGSTTSVSYTDKTAATGKTYYYKAKAYKTVSGSNIYSGYSAIVYAKAVPAVPASFTAAKASSTSVKTSWKAVSGASGYEVWMATSSGGTYSKIATTTKTTYTKTKLTKNKTYYFKARAYKTVNGTKVYGAFTSVKSAKPS